MSAIAITTGLLIVPALVALALGGDVSFPVVPQSARERLIIAGKRR